VGLSELNAVRGGKRWCICLRSMVGRTIRRQTIGAAKSAPSRRPRRNASRHRCGGEFDLETLYDKARAQLKGIEYAGAPPNAWPAACPFTLNELPREERTTLETGCGRPP